MNPQPSWQHHLRVEPDHTIVLLSGEIDINGADQLLNLLESAIHATQRVDVDIEAVRFIDSTVISVLISARSTAMAAGTKFAVINPSGGVRRVLRITGVLDVLLPTST